MNAKAIQWPQGRFNPAGTKRVFYAFQEDILSFPTLADSETGLTFESLVEYDGPIVMKTGKQFFPLYCTVETGEIRSTIAGPRDGKGFENVVGISFPGSEAEFLGFVASSANRNLVFIVEEKNNKVRVLGDLTDPAFLDTSESNSGKAIADGRTTVLEFKASSATPPPIYKTALASILTPAT